MNAPNSKNANSNKDSKKSLSQKTSPYFEFNKKLDDFISDIKSKSSSPDINPKVNGHSKNYGNLSNKCIFDNNSILNINSEEKNQNNLEESQLMKAKKRINFEKFMNGDQFAENYLLEPSVNFDDNNNGICDLPYSQTFEDSILLKDESIFFVFDNVYRNKFLTKEDINKFKKEDIKLNFGKDPYEIFEQIFLGRISPHDKTSIEFYNSLNYFNIFKTRNPHFMKMSNQIDENTDDYFNMINNNNFNKINEQFDNYEYIQNDSLISTRQNSKTNPNTNSFNLNEKDLILNNVKILKKETENYEGKENENNLDNKYIGKKRKSKK